MAQPTMRAFIDALQPRRTSVWGRPWLADLLPFLNLPGAQYTLTVPKAETTVMFPNSFRAAWMALCSGTKRRIGFRGQWRRFLLTDAPAPRVSLMTQHHRDYYLDLAEQTGIPVRRRQVQLACPEKEVRAGETRLRNRGLDPAKTIAIAPGARFGGAKRYPADGWAHVLAGLTAGGYHILALGTREERPIASLSLGRCSGTVWNAAGETGLREGLELLAASRMLLCNDSGLMHVAAGLDKPVVAIFGATDPARTAPSGACVELLYRPADCSPCLQRECTVAGHPCMANILPQDILDTSLGLLKS